MRFELGFFRFVEYVRTQFVDLSLSVSISCQRTLLSSSHFPSTHLPSIVDLLELHMSPDLSGVEDGVSMVVQWGGLFL